MQVLSKKVIYVTINNSIGFKKLLLFIRSLPVTTMFLILVIKKKYINYLRVFKYKYLKSICHNVDIRYSSDL